MADGENAKQAFAHGGNDVVAQHQVLDVVLRDDDGMRTVQSAFFADVEKSLDLFVDAADYLDAAELIDRPGDRDVLLQRTAG